MVNTSYWTRIFWKMQSFKTTVLNFTNSMPIYICNKNILIISRPYYTGKQNNFARNKVGKPNSTLCAELKYVSLFPSCIVFKWREMEIWRKLLCALYYKEYMHYLKSNSDSFSATFCLWRVSSKCPAIISQHTGTLFALVPLFHGEITLCAHRSLHRDFLGRSLSENLRNAPFDIFRPTAL